MKRIAFIFMFLSMGFTVFCKTWTVTNSGIAFTPPSITINVGDSVKFQLETMHNVVEVSQATWNANGNTSLPGFSVPYGGGLLLPAQLTVGTHYYVCSPHASLGMKGVIIVQNTTTGIAENHLQTNFSVYPNPSNGKFQVEIYSPQNAKNYNLEIFNLLGNKVYSTSRLIQQNSNRIDFSDFPKGIYFIRLDNRSDIYVKKVVVQ